MSRLWRFIIYLTNLILCLILLSVLISLLPDPSYFAAARTVNPIPTLDNPLQPVRDVFYGISTAEPGTFARILRKWYLSIIANSTTSAAITPPITTAIPSIASGASAIGTGALAGAGARALILTIIYVTWMVASLITGGGA